MSFEKKPMVPIVNEGLLYASGCLIENSTVDPVNQVVVQTGQVRDSTNTFDINFDTALVVDLTVQGLGGQTEAGGPVDAWYAIFVLSSKLRGLNNVLAVPQFDELGGIPEVPQITKNGVTYDLNRFVAWVRFQSGPASIDQMVMVENGSNSRTIYEPGNPQIFSFSTNVHAVDIVQFPGFLPPVCSSYQGTVLLSNTDVASQTVKISILEADVPLSFLTLTALSPGGRRVLEIPVVRTVSTGQIFLAGQFLVGPFSGDTFDVSVNSYSFTI